RLLSGGLVGRPLRLLRPSVRAFSSLPGSLTLRSPRLDRRSGLLIQLVFHDRSPVGDASGVIMDTNCFSPRASVTSCKKPEPGDPPVGEDRPFLVLGSRGVAEEITAMRTKRVGKVV